MSDDLSLHPANFPDLVVGENLIVRMRAANRSLAALKVYLTERLDENPYDAGALWDMSQVMLAEGKRRDGLHLQAQAIALRRTFRIVHGDGSGPVILALVVPGDQTANLPVDTLLHGSNCTLWLCYILPDPPEVADLPAHDVVIVAAATSHGTPEAKRAITRMRTGITMPVVDEIKLNRLFETPGRGAYDIPQQDRCEALAALITASLIPA